MNALLVSLISFWKDLTDCTDREKGATATEYALLVGLIALVIIFGVTAFGTALEAFFDNLASTVASW